MPGIVDVRARRRLQRPTMLVGVSENSDILGSRPRAHSSRNAFRRASTARRGYGTPGFLQYAQVPPYRYLSLRQSLLVGISPRRAVEEIGDVGDRWFVKVGERAERRLRRT